MAVLESLYTSQLVYKKQYEFFCPHNAVDQLLNHFGVVNYELMMNSSLRLGLKIDSQQPCGVSASAVEYCPVIDRGRSVDFYCVSDSRDSAAVWRMNQKSIDEGRPVVVGVDTFYLPYHDNYHKENGAHTIIIYGYDDSSQVALVKDYFKLYRYTGCIPYEALRLARNSANAWNWNVNSGGNIRYASFSMDYRGARPGIQDIGYTISVGLDQYYGKEFSTLTTLCDLLCRGEPGVAETRREYYRSLHAALLLQNERKQLFLRYLKQIRSWLQSKSARPRMWKELVVCEENLCRFTEICSLWKDCLLTILLLAYEKKLRKLSTLQEELVHLIKRICECEADYQASLQQLSDLLSI